MVFVSYSQPYLEEYLSQENWPFESASGDIDAMQKNIFSNWIYLRRECYFGSVVCVSQRYSLDCDHRLRQLFYTTVNKKSITTAVELLLVVYYYYYYYLFLLYLLLHYILSSSSSFHSFTYTHHNTHTQHNNKKKIKKILAHTTIYFISSSSADRFSVLCTVCVWYTHS